MSFPDYFAQVPPLTLRDPLAEFLGAAEGGRIEYTFADAVRLTGHACPTVAGAYLMTCRALNYLYGQERPVRGDILVQFHDGEEDGATGVMAAVAGLLTGAAGRGGFRGLAGRHARRNRLRFGVTAIQGIARFSRLDSDLAVDADIDLSILPPAPGLNDALGQALAGQDQPEFARRWQERVRQMLLDHGTDPELIRLRRAELPRPLAA